MRLALIVLLAAGPAQVPALAQTLQGGLDLSQASLEELMNIRITSVARRAQRAEDVAAAVFVITREDIRRSGLTALPEILRLAPGVQVAQVNGSKWAVSIRGFNDLFANKLLVLVDGQSVYHRSFGGVIWEARDPFIEDIERIEVVRGPGGAVWGANAVNGVINIITRSAADTQGLAVNLSAGTLERARAAVRYGGAIGKVDYRVFSQWSGYADAETALGASAEDRWDSLTTGARTDWAKGANAVFARAYYTTGTQRPNFPELQAMDPAVPLKIGHPTEANEVSVLGRWTRTRTSGAVLQVQAYNSVRHRDDSALTVREHASDLDVQYETTAGPRHAFVTGGGYRNVDLQTTGSLTLTVAPEHASVFNGFLQDEITVHRKVRVTLGSKIEHDSEAGWGLSPSARVMWLPAQGQRTWAALSRARRTPAATDRTLRVNIGVLEVPEGLLLLGFEGNPHYEPETHLAAEAGYRTRLGPTAAIEVAVFRGHYDNLPTFEPLPPALELTPTPAHVYLAWAFGNLLNARATGVEINGTWTPTRSWSLKGSYSALRVTMEREAASRDQTPFLPDGQAPRHQWQIHSLLAPTAFMQVDASLSYTGRLHLLEVPAYTRADVRLELKLSDDLAAVVSGRNLLDRRHPEFGGLQNVRSHIPRSALVQLRWRH